MRKPLKIAVASATFSKCPELVAEINKYHFDEIRLNTTSSSFSRERLKAVISGVSGLIVGRDRIDRSLLSGCRELKVISKFGVGIDNIDIEACRDSHIKVVFSSGINKRSVAEQTLYFMIGSIRNLNRAGLLLKKGTWKKDGGRQLTGKTIGIIGVGNIGKEIISLLKPFDNKIMVNDIIEQSDYYNEQGLIEATKEAIYEECDIISLHTPLTELTKNLIHKDVLKRMKKHAFLINTARGPVVNREDLKWALKNGIIAGAAVDVYDTEPPADKEFLELENLICTPHIAGNAQEAIIAMGRNAIDNLIGFFNDQQKNGNAHPA